MAIFFILLFWASTLGYFLFVKNKLKLDDELIFGFIFIILTFLLFIFGILNMLRLGSLIILLSGIVAFIYLMKTDNEFVIHNIKRPNYNILLILILFVYVTIVFSNFHLIHYDNFTHWGLIVKNMILYSRFPNFENSAIIFSGYQPGSACFIYYFSHVFGLNEGYMIVAQNYLVIALLSSLFVFNKNGKNKLFTILTLFSIVFVTLANTMPYDLLVDTLLSAVFIYVFVIIYKYRKDLTKLFYLLLLVSLYLCLIKNAGYTLTFIVCLLYFFICLNEKKVKQGIVGSLIIGLSALAILYVWTQHVKLVYGYSALYSHHSLTLNNIKVHLGALGLSGIKKFLTIYLRAFVDIKNNISALIITILNLISFSFLFTYKSRKKEILNSIVTVDVVYIIYYIFLGLMYICSMEIDGLFVLVALNRYLLTITIPLITITIMLYMNIYSQCKRKLYNYIYFVLILVLMGLYTFKYKLSFDFIKLYVGKTSYENSYLSKLDSIITKEYSNVGGNGTFYLYAPSYKNNWGLVMYATRYKTNHDSVKTCLNVEDIEEIRDNSLVILLEEDNTIFDFIDENNLCEVSKNIYRKCEVRDE